ncbi:LysR family transcriptional regulator [Aureimonas sp. AU20]|uniref:LysR family transcriptional regulator n=1 Tax=Aureimonas sp. AU20 TaxID=1349819 RepID=UPI00071F4C9B|nr:LysR family transcriptional regulator [Aureimonas sp. AU20]ALN74854.1 hypothetical protein M673_19195 [Aureimonas sp. AU20]
MEHLLQSVDWDGVKVILAVADRQSFRQAAQDLGRSVNTLRGIVDRLEDQFGFPVFNRHVDGAKLTVEGRRVVSAARLVERSMMDLMRVAQSASDTMKGPVRLAVTEGIGTFWIVPQLVDFLAGPGRDIQVTLQCALQAVDVLRLEADISIQTAEPTAFDVVKHKIGCVHMTLFAGRAYAERHGLPTTLAELADHRIIEQEMDQFTGYGLDRIYTPEIAERIVALRTNFASAHYWAIAKGAGIGMLPNYAAAIGGDLVPLDLGLRIPVDLWLAVHPEMVKTARHRAVVEWLDTCFSAETYPWFGDRYMAPEEIEAFLRGSTKLKGYFSGFTPLNPMAEPLPIDKLEQL